MDGLAEVFFVENLEQMRALADPRRMRIFERLARQPMTVTQLGEQLGDSAAKVHYHVRELERLGVVKLVETREKGGILEKYYRAVAKDIQIAPDLLRTSPPDELNGMLQEWFKLVMADGLKALGVRRRDPDSQDPLAFESSTIWATSEEFRGILNQIQTLRKGHEEPREVAGEREWTLSIIAHPVVEVENSNAEELVPPVPPIPPLPLRDRRIFVAGAMSFDRHELERAVAEGRHIAISILGVCHFANDIPAELVERAVSTFHHRGILQASPEVRAVLQRKGKILDTTDNQT